MQKEKVLLNEHVVSVVQSLRMARYHEVPLETPMISAIVREVEQRLPSMDTRHRSLVAEIFMIRGDQVVGWARRQ